MFLFIKKIVLIIIMVFIIFLVLSENEGRIEKAMEPPKAMIDRKIEEVQDDIKGYISSKKVEYKEKINEQIDRVETKITQLIFDDDDGHQIMSEDHEGIDKPTE